MAQEPAKWGNMCVREGILAASMKTDTLIRTYISFCPNICPCFPLLNSSDFWQLFLYRIYTWFLHFQ